MKQDNKRTGNRGEDIATEYLQKKGYEIEERNFRTRFGEIDIVCWDAQTLVFVEVKTKIGHDFGEPEEMFNKNKMGQVKRMGEIYMIEKNQKLEKSNNKNLELLEWIPDQVGNDNKEWNGGCRVDLVAIVLKENGEVEKMEHYEAVY